MKTENNAPTQQRRTEMSGWVLDRSGSSSSEDDDPAWPCHSDGAHAHRMGAQLWCEQHARELLEKNCCPMRDPEGASRINACVGLPVIPLTARLPGDPRPDS